MGKPYGREVLLSDERWRHIVSAHPEIEVYEKEVCRTVESPTTTLAGREPDEEWLTRFASTATASWSG
jgi:hypothetical protein